MKKALVLVLLVSLLTLVFVSCDANIRSNIADMMGNLGGNVYIDNGLVAADTSDAEAAAETIAAIGTGGGAVDVSSTGTTTTLGISITVPAGATTILAPQSEAEQDDLNNSLAEAFSSPTQTAALLEELQKPVTSDQVTAATGTILVFNETLNELKSKITGDTELADTLASLALPEVESGDQLTQGDLLALQLMTNLISNTVSALNTISGSDLTTLDSTDLANNQDQVLSIVSDALLTASVVEQISGAASIDFSGQVDLASLLENLNKGSRAAEPISLTDAGDFIGTINNIAPDIIDLMGVQYSGGSYTYSKDAYKQFLTNQQAYRSAIEHALKFKEQGNLTKEQLQNSKLDTSTLLKYALSVFFTEHHAYWKSKSISSPRPEAIIAAYLNANPKLADGTLTTSDTLTAPTVDTFTYDGWPTFLKTRAQTYYESIIKNLITLNDINGIAQLSTELQKFLDEGIADWYTNL